MKKIIVLQYFMFKKQFDFYLKVVEYYKVYKFNYWLMVKE